MSNHSDNQNNTSEENIKFIKCFTRLSLIVIMIFFVLIIAIAVISICESKFDTCLFYVALFSSLITISMICITDLIEKWMALEYEAQRQRNLLGYYGDGHTDESSGSSDNTR